MSVVVTADRGFTWSDEETALLLQLWGDTNAQTELTGSKRNFVVYEKISDTMNTMGFIRTASQCREKIKRMKREYTLTKQNNEKSNSSKKSMRFYEQFEKILLEKQSQNQRSTTLKLCPNDSELEEIECKKSDAPPKLIKTKVPIAIGKKRREVETDTGNPWSPDVVLVEGEGTPSQTLFESQNSASTSITNGDLPSKKKRKISSRISMFKCMMDSLTLKFMKYQTESDERMLNKIEQLENERNAMDERIQKMWMDFEERRSADAREHEINIMNLMQQGLEQGL
ncbi:zinc finger and SCAN domain-containing protein 29-like [Uloborus diversus]|uniref:zinc finger and SCAN domain-containing protein 29-like n=1 Tax=Uloborus diversus TaxID=327109 RepID=UPI0024093F3C|nr:zinc finger and SCAN domain-containing protein 29-like [Uloborus diversus]